MNKESKIYIAGHRGMVGSAVLRKYEAEGYGNIVTRNSSELDLRDQAAVREFFTAEKAGLRHPRRGEGRGHHGQQVL
jgi:GDP-L-fucose synthase